MTMATKPARYCPRNDPSSPRTAPVIRAADVEAAAERLSGVIRHTPLERSARLSAQTGAEVYLKREDLQPVRSYKLRGAYNLMASLTPEERRVGVVCASAGNHAQGVAFACRELSIRAQIFVPATTPRQKQDRIMAIGGDWVDLVVGGGSYDDAAAAAGDAAVTTGAVRVPAFDDERIMAGQGTVVREIVTELGDAPDVLIVPVGGGGLISGCLTWLAENVPTTRVIGVEPAGAAALAAALEAGEPVALGEMETFVDGAAVRRIGDHPFQVVAEHRPRVVSVPEGRVCSEMLRLYQVDGIISEPAGALAPAVLASPGHDPIVHVEAGARVVAILTGGNNDVSRYGEIVERSLVFEGRKHYFLVNFPQEPGALRRFLDDVLGPHDDITLFEYVKRNNRETGPALVGVELRHRDDLGALLERIGESTLQVTRVDAGSMLHRYLL